MSVWDGDAGSKSISTGVFPEGKLESQAGAGGHSPSKGLPTGQERRAEDALQEEDTVQAAQGEPRSAEMCAGGGSVWGLEVPTAPKGAHGAARPRTGSGWTAHLRKGWGREKATGSGGGKPTLMGRASAPARCNDQGGTETESISW